MTSADQDTGNDGGVVQLSKPEFVNIADLEPERLGFSINCRVYSVKRKLCREQLNGDIVRIYEAVIYDDTAAITMTLKGESQISAVKPGDNLTLRNVKVSMHNFHMRLACDRWGLIEKDSDSRIKAKTDEQGVEQVPANVSDQEYERIDESDDEDGGQNNQGSPGRSSNRGLDNRNRRGRGRGRGRGFRGRGRGRGRFRGGGPRRGDPRRGPPFGGPRRGRGRGRGRPRGRGGRGLGRGRRSPGRYNYAN